MAKLPWQKTVDELAKRDPRDLDGPQHDAVRLNTDNSHPVHRTPRPGRERS